MPGRRRAAGHCLGKSSSSDLRYCNDGSTQGAAPSRDRGPDGVTGPKYPSALFAVERLCTHRFAFTRQSNFLDLVFRRLQELLAMDLQRLAALVDSDRLIERHITALQIIDDALQRSKCLLEAHRGNVVVGRNLGHLSSLHQASYVGGSGKRQPMQVVSAFQKTDQPSIRPAVSFPHQLCSRPVKVVLDEIEFC